MKRLWAYKVPIAFAVLTLTNAYAIRQNRVAIDKTDRVAVTAARAARGAEQAINRIRRESLERRDQSCLGDELEHLKDVRRLRQTYKFLLDPPPSLRDLVPLVRIQLPVVEDDARDRAPLFCDETQPDGSPVGLPEPDPRIPERPRALR